jgi:hypothetical protein
MTNFAAKVTLQVETGHLTLIGSNTSFFYLHSKTLAMMKFLKHDLQKLWLGSEFLHF